MTDKPKENLVLFPGVQISRDPNTAPAAHGAEQEPEVNEIREILDVAEELIEKDIVVLGYNSEGGLQILTGAMSDERVVYLLNAAAYMVLEGSEIEEIE